MAVGRALGRLVRPVASCCIAAGLVVFALSAVSPSASSTRSVHGTLRVLQFNLCNSGIADCYTGRSVSRAGAFVIELRPDVVTLNEVCRRDVAALGRSLGDDVVSAFGPALSGHGNRPVLCRNGDQYGIGLLAHGPAGSATYGGTYPMQDPRDVEKRVWLCVRTVTLVCTTHLDSTTPAIAFAQCRYLLTRALPALLPHHGRGRVVVAGDLNLRTGHSPDPLSCLPAGYAHADDGARQHVAAAGYAVASTGTLDMQGSTDHPGLLVDLTLR